MGLYSWAFGAGGGGGCSWVRVAGLFFAGGVQAGAGGVDSVLLYGTCAGIPPVPLHFSYFLAGSRC